MTPKTNIDKWDYMKLKNICASQDTIGRENNQWNEIKYLRTIYLRGTKYPEYVRTLTIHLQGKKQPSLKVGKIFEKHFTKEDIPMAKKHTNRCLASLVVRGNKLKPQ